MFKSSIVSYGENGRNTKYGSFKYRGNTDGGIVNDFLDYCGVKFKRPVKTCSDYMAGSFTTKDVCLERGIDGFWTDLSRGFNMLLDSCVIPDRPETIFWHPPYSSLIQIPYAGAEWDDKEFERKYGYDPKPYDLGRMEWGTFTKALDYCMIKQFAALETGGRIGVLCGDIRRSGIYKSMLLEISKPGILESIVIKRQTHTSSGNRTYGKGTLSFIPIEQEYFFILKKELPYMLDFSYVNHIELDIRDSEKSTWKDVVASCIEKCGGSATLTRIYNEMDGHSKCNSNNYWKDKIRQTLRRYEIFKSSGDGIWFLAA